MRFNTQIVFCRFFQLIMVAVFLAEAFFLYHGLSSKDLLQTGLSVLVILVLAVGFLVLEKFVREGRLLLRENRDIVAGADDLLRRHTTNGKSKE